MKKVEFTINTFDGAAIVSGFEVVPGLAVHQDGESPFWLVTHYRSGGVVTETDAGPEHAAFLASKCAPFADWTLPGAELRKALGRFGTDIYDVVPRPLAYRVASQDALTR